MRQTARRSALAFRLNGADGKQGQVVRGMASNQTGTPWGIPNQTIGKHLVLRNYLRGWLPILGRYQSRLLL